MMEMRREPLAERMRPQTLDDVIGQTHLLGDAEILRRIVKQGEPVSLILWGPPGTGKTTLARIIAREVRAEFIELSAVTSGKKDVEKVIEHARQNWNLQLRTVLFVDEIHRFNKAQQDAFLPHVESGLITLIGATTENPSFEVITPLLSRTRVLVLQPLSKDEIISVISATDEKAEKFIPQQQIVNNKVKLSFVESPTIAGNYNAFKDNSILKNISFNYPRTESDLSLDNSNLVEKYENGNSMETVFNTLQTNRIDNAVWKWFVWLTLLFLVLEVLIQKFVK